MALVVTPGPGPGGAGQLSLMRQPLAASGRVPLGPAGYRATRRAGPPQ